MTTGGTIAANGARAICGSGRMVRRWTTGAAIAAMAVAEMWTFGFTL